MSEGCTSFSGGDISPGTLRACPQMSAHCRAKAKIRIELPERFNTVMHIFSEGKPSA